MSLRSTAYLAGVGIVSAALTLYGLMAFVNAATSLNASGIVVSFALVAIFGLVFLSQVAKVAGE